MHKSQQRSLHLYEIKRNFVELARENEGNQSYFWLNRPNHGPLAQTRIQKKLIWEFSFRNQRI